MVIVDQSKMCDALGPHFMLPIEILPFCHEHTMRCLEALPSMNGAKAVLRMGSSANNKCDGDEIAVSDNGCYLVDMKCTSPITDAVRLADDIIKVVGVVEHGLFCGMTDHVIIAGTDGIEVKDVPK